jgi:hypothetical protein
MSDAPQVTWDATPAAQSIPGIKWDDEKTETSLVASRPTPTAPVPQPGVLGRSAMPGTASRYSGPQSVALGPQARAERDAPLDVATHPFREMATGTEELTGRAPGQTESQIQRGLHHVIAGAAEAAAPVVLPVAAAAAPVATAISLGGSYLGQKAGKAGAEALGASEDTSNLVGDVGAVAGGYLGAEAAPRMGSAVQSVKDSIGRAVRVEPTPDTVSTRGNLDTPKRFSTLKPLAKAVASVGKIVGGPEIFNAALPDHPVKIGPFSRLSNRVPVPEPELPGVGAPLPDAAEFYENKGDELMRRGKEQDALDRKAARDERTAAKSRVSIVSEGGNNVADPRTTGSEGRPATWKNAALPDMAKGGSRPAIEQLTRRGLPLPENTRYVMGDQDFPRSVLNPREVTRFAPDGTPIRDVANPTAQNPSSRARIQIVGEQPSAKVKAPNPQESIDFGKLPEPGRSLPQVEQPTAAVNVGAKPPLPSVEEYETALTKNGMNSVDAHTQARDDLAQLRENVTLPEASKQVTRERIDRAMSGQKLGVTNVGKDPAQVSNETEASRSEARRSRDFSKHVEIKKNGSAQHVIEDAGGKFVGIQKGYGARPDQVLFQATDGGTTLSLDVDKVSPEAVRKKMGN